MEQELKERNYREGKFLDYFTAKYIVKGGLPRMNQIVQVKPYLQNFVNQSIAEKIASFYGCQLACQSQF